MRFIIAATLLLFLAGAPGKAEEIMPDVKPRQGAILGIINSIEVTGNTVVSDEDILKAIPVEPGDLLNIGTLDRTVTAVENAYRDRGYLAVVGNDTVETFQNTGTLTIRLNEVKLQDVRFEGLKKTKPYVILRLLEQHPGDVYDLFALRRDAETLQSLMIFHSVDASVESSAASGEVVVVWKVEELKQTGFVSLGGSYAPRDSLVGNVSLTESNFRRRVEQLSLSASLGSIGGRLSGELSYFTPWIAKRTSLSVRAFDLARHRFSRDLIDDPDTGRYYERRSGLQLLAKRSLSTARSISSGIRYENVRQSHFPYSFFERSDNTTRGSIVAVSGEYMIDQRDALNYPTKGTLRRASIEAGRANPKGVGSNWIEKAGVEYRWFVPLSRATDSNAVQYEARPQVMAFRVSASTSGGSPPFFEQYFLGGADSLRGYIEGRYWGKHLVTASAEYRRPISRKLTGLAFVDAGDAWDSDFQFDPGIATDFRQHKGFSPQIGAGAGIRYATDYGSVGLDCAWGDGFHTYLVAGRFF